ncbi:hypothetical protein GJV44_00146 [Candidatus Vallotia cooleyia]|nr:hypothetical protein GJV44_00146 [Candidatus Vallotia cooleyia]
MHHAILYETCSIPDSLGYFSIVRKDRYSYIVCGSYRSNIALRLHEYFVDVPILSPVFTTLAMSTSICNTANAAFCPQVTRGSWPAPECDVLTHTYFDVWVKFTN